MQQVSVAALRIVYEAVFPALEFPHPECAMAELTVARSDATELLAYATAISSNDTGNAAYYEQLATQLRTVIFDRDMVRLTARHNRTARVAPATTAQRSWMRSS